MWFLILILLLAPAYAETVTVDPNNQNVTYAVRTPQEQADLDAQEAIQAPIRAALLNTQQRQGAIDNLADKNPTNKDLRAILLVAIDEINLLRDRDNDRSTDVAAATSLADLKTRWAARASLPDRTFQQLINATQGKIQSGTAD